MKYLIKFICFLFTVLLGTVILPVITLAQNTDVDKPLESGLEELLALDLEELVVYVASKRQEKINDAPGVVSVISSGEIKRFGANNLQDLLTRLPNVFTFGSEIFRDNVTSIRGQTLTHGDNHVLILFNGRPFRDSHVGGFNNVIYTAFPLEVIERIEMIRGPGSALYGTNAYSGVINIITKTPTKDPGNEITAGYGSNNTFLSSGYLNKQWDDFSFVVSGRFFDSDGWTFRATDSLGTSDSVDYSQKNYGIFAQAKYKDITFSGFSLANTNTNLGFFPRFPASEETLDRKRYFFDAEYSQNLAKNWDASYNFTFNGTENTTDTGPAISYFNYLFESSVRGKIFEKLNVLAGGVFESLNGDLDTKQTSYSSDRFNAYIQIDYKFLERLKLIAGTQINKVQGIDANVSPRFGAILDLPENFGIKLLYGEAFRSPFAAEQALNASTLKGNPELDPETIRTFDAQLFYSSPKTYFAITYYDSLQEDTITRAARSDGILTFVNMGEVDFEGIEVESKYRPNTQWEFLGSVSYQVNEDQSGQRDVGLVPNFMGKWGVSYDSPNGFSIGLFDSYFGESAELSGAPKLNPDADSYHWMTLKSSLELRKYFNANTIPNIRLNLFVDNLLDEDVYFPEFNFSSVNTLPSRTGIAIYGSATIKF
jgi:outer membrane receptor for ferrienterochelin and colicins